MQLFTEPLLDLTCESDRELDLRTKGMHENVVYQTTQELLDVAAPRSVSLAGLSLRPVVSGFSQLLRLNTRVVGLALTGQWLTTHDVAEGYDRVALTYNEAWQHRLRPVTDLLLDRLPTGLQGSILDLGCGTGYATKHLATRNPAATVRGVDISAGMLAQARPGAPPNAEFVAGDMLQSVRSNPTGSARMIISTWALGYSHPSKLFKECHRVLEKDGTLGFVVNYLDTLGPVFRAFQKCMLKYPDRVQRAAWPRFPRNWSRLAAQLEGSGLSVEWHVDGEEKIVIPDGPFVPWLKQTGILAGFDALLDLSGAVEEWFEAELQRDTAGIVHHYAAAIARNL
jgi:SAM-dependent methyltransferase